MFGIVWHLIPIALGVIASPVAVMALLGILLSRNARRNCGAFAAGWGVAIIASLGFFLGTFALLGVSEHHDDGVVVRVLHAMIGLLCLTGAVWTYRRARTVLQRVAAARTPEELTAATPQLPGLLHSTEEYTPLRSFTLGLGVFLLNPMNLSLVAASAIDLLAAGLDAGQLTALAVAFVLAAASPVLVPTVLIWMQTERATDWIGRLRGWILHNNGFLRAGILLLVGFLQLERALEGLLW